MFFLSRSNMKSYILISILSCFLSANAGAKTIRLAVGHDHPQMVANNYSIYKANWFFLTKSLELMGHELVANPMPWARAKSSVISGNSHGLFLAANFDGRHEWATLSKPLGYEVFGFYYHIENKTDNGVIGSVRIGKDDRILSFLDGKNLLNVTTAQDGLKLLHNKRVDRFVMARGYGDYILAKELRSLRPNILFDPHLSERRSLHVAVAKGKTKSLEALTILNNAIERGIKAGYYQEAMKRNNVSLDMQIIEKP